jgi:hypothetical protein
MYYIDCGKIKYELLKEDDTPVPSWIRIDGYIISVDFSGAKTPDSWNLKLNSYFEEYPTVTSSSYFNVAYSSS